MIIPSEKKGLWCWLVCHYSRCLKGSMKWGHVNVKGDVKPFSVSPEWIGRVGHQATARWCYQAHISGMGYYHM